MFGIKPLQRHCGHLLEVSLTCTNTTNVAALSRFLSLVYNELHSVCG